jgi:subtilisin family serine protease
MRSLSIFLTCSCLIGVAATATWGGNDPPCAPWTDPVFNGRLIVRLNAGASPTIFLSFLEQEYPGISAAVLDSFAGFDTYLISYQVSAVPDLGALEAKLNGAYVASGKIKWGELLYVGQPPEGKTGTIWVDSPISIANYQSQYALTKTNASAALKMSTGLGVVVAVLDTGVDAAHPQFQGKIAPGGINLIANAAQGEDVSDTSDTGEGNDDDGDGEIDEMVGHGTYVAGLISLVAPDSLILPVKVLNSDGVGDLWTIAKGIHYAINHGVEVINISLSSTYSSNAIYDALIEARLKGIVAVAAAGNFNVNCPREYPAMSDVDVARFPDEWLVFGVAASDSQDLKAPFSNFHKNLFITAPGDSVTNALGNPDLGHSFVSTIPGGGYRVWEGTSMSAAMVSAAAALIRAQHPEWNADYSTWQGVRDAIMNTAADIYAQNSQYAPDSELGVGRIDIGSAVAVGPQAPQLGDLNNDGAVDVDDLLKIINDWGLTHTSADLNGSGVVDVDDLLIVINQWSA